MNIQSRLLSVDFYNCKGEKYYDEDALRAKITEILHSLRLTPMQMIADFTGINPDVITVNMFRELAKYWQKVKPHKQR